MEAKVTPSGAPRPNGLSARVLKTMSVFGGVQVLQLLCSVVRTKLVAIWMGAAGVGLFGIFMAAYDMVATLTRLGFESSSVRDLAACRGDRRSLALLMRVVRRWGWITGLLGAFAIIIVAPWLSMGSFGDYRSTWLFMLLSVGLVLDGLTHSSKAVLQGLGHFKRLARANLWGVVGGVAVSVPLFYWFRLDSIVPSILAYTLASFIAYQCCREKEPELEADQRFGMRYALQRGRPIIVLGIYMTATGFATSLVAYTFMSWLNLEASVDMTGYFQGGFTLINRYVGILFMAVGVEYFPRLSLMVSGESPSCSRRGRASLCVAHEAGLLLWLLLPLIPAFILCAPLLVRLIYKTEFLVIVPYITIGMLAIPAKALSWSMAFVILARGDGRTYLATEVGSEALYLVLNIAGYSLWGLTGLGWAYLVWYLAYVALIAAVYVRRYGMTLPRDVAWLCVAVTLTGAVAAAVALLWPSLWWANLLLTAAASLVAFRRLKVLVAR